jgi:hypothetical protein
MFRPVFKESSTALTCNIDEHGARVRRIWGAFTLGLGLAAAGTALWTGIGWLWIIAALGMGMGVLAFFEARKKWCVIRAMGIKTPL